MEPFYKDGLNFECTQCHACCRHDPGYVFLSRLDLDRLCTVTGLSIPQFVDTHCRWVDLGDGFVLSLQEKRNFDCIFWNSGCTVYEGRPTQCRTYPFWENPTKSRDNWVWEGRFCPGIGRGKLHTSADIERALDQRRQAPVLRKGDL